AISSSGSGILPLSENKSSGGTPLPQKGNLMKLHINNNRKLHIGLLAGGLAVVLAGCSNNQPAQAPATSTGATVAAPVELLNVSYDPTRELYQKFNAVFAKHWKKKTG